MPGYARMPAETRRSYTPEAFLLSGDLGIIDEDGNAAVDDVCVIGVPHDILGELVCACIGPVEGAGRTRRGDQGLRPSARLPSTPHRHHKEVHELTSHAAAPRPRRTDSPGPQAMPAVSGPIHTHAPNAALLIDFDNVTMGIRSDLQQELRNLLGSDIIKGKVSVQRAYADWRRYPQYIVPLAESSIDMIMAPAYGSAKKNATDIRLAVDAMELVFTRPRSARTSCSPATPTSRASSQAQGIRQVRHRRRHPRIVERPARDELRRVLQLQRARRPREGGEEEVVQVGSVGARHRGDQAHEANGDVMRADRLKQVMQQIDSSFDEKNLGMSKFSRFVTRPRSAD